ncbi:hypothetical protein PILCRDRAFT_16677 [Piloderma croceum F 1598]|uniref:Uncharacterized protein n=1 Tax=Piloderma croceum (strain F 1598) TaxID=765440 RepID=A0A0C3ADG8_PILCF|nr:hypothetical protein PILCRDRAFT_16677 [Piloderma croceum F 1598]
MVNLTITENVKVMEIGDDKENDDSDKVEGGLRKKASKKKVPIYESNTDKNTHIQELHEEWTCMKPESVCHNTYC